ncbi:hypothetical protein EYF80_051612 [Liparis tanakae]|uniref:Uncharacterized protein n=1 Tax=Liparis tanakae TaxID=230148 RepID=A0A4Z2FBG1_9TELE|nr:hypothetical protein EYF80_051612 [Liparis tanakae]
MRSPGGPVKPRGRDNRSAPAEREHTGVRKKDRKRPVVRGAKGECAVRLVVVRVVVVVVVGGGAKALVVFLRSC